MATEQLNPASDDVPGEETKPSLLKKVKDKAKRLKSKLKHHSKADPVSTPASGDQDDSSDGHDSDSSSEDTSNEENVRIFHGVPYTPVDKLIHRGAPAGPKSTNGEPSPHGGANPATLKSPAAGQLQQAVPTHYNYSGNDAEAAWGAPPDAFSDEKRLQRDAGRHSDTGNGESRLIDLLHARNPSWEQTFAAEAKQSKSQDLVINNVVPQDKGVGFSKDLPPSALDIPNGKKPSTIPGHVMSPKGSATETPLQATDGAPKMISPEDDPSPRLALTPANSLQKGSDPLSSGAEDATVLLQKARDVVSRQSLESTNSSDERRGSPLAEMVPTRGDHQADEEPVMKREFGVLNHVAEEPSVPRTTAASGPQEEHNVHSLTRTKEAHGNPFPTQDAAPKSNDQEINSAKNADVVASGTTNASDPGEQQTPVTGLLSSFTVGLKDKVVGVLGSSQQHPSAISTPAVDKADGSKTLSEMQPASEAFNNESDLKPPSTGCRDGKEPHEVNSVASKAEVSEETPSSFTKQADVNGGGDEDPSSAGYFNPDHHHQDLANSITESISGLPALLTSKLGLGGGTTGPKAASKDATTPSQFEEDAECHEPVLPTKVTTTFDEPSVTLEKGEEEKDTVPSNSTSGLLDRVSGMASSIFGGGAQKTGTADHAMETSSPPRAQ